jgi:hypothetical protein
VVLEFLELLFKTPTISLDTLRLLTPLSLRQLLDLVISFRDTLRLMSMPLHLRKYGDQHRDRALDRDLYTLLQQYPPVATRREKLVR